MTSNFGLKLKELRISHGLSQQELAQKLNCHKNVISNYELGKRIPNGDTLADIARVVGVSVDYLLGLEKPEMLPISGLNDKQKMILATLSVELSSHSPKKTKRLTARQMGILNDILGEFSTEKD